MRENLPSCSCSCEILLCNEWEQRLYSCFAFFVCVGVIILTWIDIILIPLWFRAQNYINQLAPFIFNGNDLVTYTGFFPLPSRNLCHTHTHIHKRTYEHVCIALNTYIGVYIFLVYHCIIFSGAWWFLNGLAVLLYFLSCSCISLLWKRVFLFVLL